MSASTERVVRMSLPAHQSGARRVHAILSVEGGMVLATQPADGVPLELRPGNSEALGVAKVLASIVAGLHQSGIVGARLDLQDVRIDSLGRCQLASWHHLCHLRMQGAGDASYKGDVDVLMSVFESMGEDLLRVLTPRPSSARDLADRLARSGRAPRALAPIEVLPALPPFLGRQRELLAVHEAVARSRHVGPELFCVTGPPGSGRSRMLHQLALELARGDSVVCVHVAHPTGDPKTRGLSRIMAAVAAALDEFPAREREQAGSRMLRAVGPLASLVHQLDKRLGALVGQGPPLPALSLDERFVRHAATAADVLCSIGTPERPLVLLFDDIQRSDASSRALLYHLLSPCRTSHLTIVYSTLPSATPSLPRDARVLELGNWSLDELEELVGACLPGPVLGTEEIAGLLLETSSGTPSTAWEALQSAVREGRIVRDGAWALGEGAHQGRLLHLAPTWRWSSLPDDPKRIATILAVRPEPAEPEWLRRVTHWPPPRLRLAANALIEVGLVVQDPSGMLRWPADSVRERVLAVAGDPAVRGAHSAVARWLRSLGDQATAAQRAWHEEHGGDDIDRGALVSLHIEGGTELLRAYDAERAQWHFDRALEAPMDSLELRRAALEGRADALLLQGHTDDALNAYLAALDVIADATSALATANRALNGLWLKGAVEASVALADRALQVVGQRLPRTMAEAAWQAFVAGLGAFLGRQGQPDDVADELCMLHSQVVAGVASSHPALVVSGLFRGLQAAGRRPSGPSARARAFFSVLPGGAGMTGWMRRILDRAEADSADDMLSRGVVLTMRGQGLMAAGFYDEGQEAVDQSLVAFRAAGDLSIGVATMAIATLYAMPREPARRLLDRLQETEAAAFRQRNQSVLPGLRGLRRLVLARCGQFGWLDEIEDESESGDLVAAVVGDSSTAMALLLAGKVSTARALAGRAMERLDAATVAPPFLEVALVAHAVTAVAESKGGSDKATLRAVRRLQRKSRSSRSLRVASAVVDARLDISEGRTAQARERLATIIETAPSHGESWYVLEAHELLGELEAGRDALAAQAHAELAAALRARLWPIEAPAPVAMAPAEEAPRAGATALDGPLHDLPTTVAPLLGRHALEVRATVGLVTSVPIEVVELLLVNLVLAARDTAAAEGTLSLRASAMELSSEDAVRYPDGTPGHWVRISIHVSGARGPGSRGALAECGALCRRAGGFFDLTPAGALEAWLPSTAPAQATDSLVAAVVHSDERVQRTLVQGVRQLGWAAQVVPLRELELDEFDLVLVEASQAHHLGQHPRVVSVVKRGADTRHAGPQLAVPFLVRELEDLLAAPKAREARAPSGAGPLSG